MLKNFVLVISIMSVAGCTLDQATLQTPTSLSSKIISEVAAEDVLIDRSNPEWIEAYCLQQLQEMVFMPTYFERERGPRLVFEPMYLPERYSQAQAVSTCNHDYYFWPVTKEAYQNLGLTYRYNQAAWDELHIELVTLITQALEPQGWQPMELIKDQPVKAPPNLSLLRKNETEQITEYLDVYLTKDEELVYELMVVAE